MGVEDRRRYVRHLIRVPLSVRPRDDSPGFSSTSGDISDGGLSFHSTSALPLGGVIDVELPVSGRRFELAGTVVVCVPQSEGAGFRVGLSFVEPGMGFRMKLAEQVVRIAELRQELSAQRGVEVSTHEAATAWVEQYAETFAEWFPQR